MANPSAPPYPAPRARQCPPQPWKLVGMTVSPQSGERHPERLQTTTPRTAQNYTEHGIKTQRDVLLMAALQEYGGVQHWGAQDSQSSGNGFNQPWAPGSDSRADMDLEERFKNALKRYVSRLPFCANSLQRQISELEAVAAALDKTHKGTRIARITGGAGGAVGGVAFVAGVLLAPATMGASLAVAAVGLGAVAAGGATGASAAITDKVKTDQVRKKVESILKEYQKEMSDIEVYLKEISSEKEKLKGVRVKSAEIVRLEEIAGGTSVALSVMNKSSGVVQGFALGMDFFFTDNNSQKLKKEAKTKFAQQICDVAGEIQAGLTELMDMRDKLQSEGV
ncbi:hypothetical protein R3I94_010520 [Phoxinus phoxinus]